MKWSIAAACTLAMAMAAAPVAAQTVYRCGNAYSQQPCEGAHVIDASDRAPSAAEARAAAARASGLEKLANQMEKDRLAQDKLVAGPAMVVTGQRQVALKPAAAASKPGHAKAKKLPVDFSASAPPREGDAKPKATGKKSG